MKGTNSTQTGNYTWVHERNCIMKIRDQDIGHEENAHDR